MPDDAQNRRQDKACLPLDFPPECQPGHPDNLFLPDLPPLLPVPIFLSLFDSFSESHQVSFLFPDHPVRHHSFPATNPSVPANDFSPVPTLTNVAVQQEADFPADVKLPDDLPKWSFLFPAFLFVLLFLGFLPPDDGFLSLPVLSPQNPSNGLLFLPLLPDQIPTVRAKVPMLFPVLYCFEGLPFLFVPYLTALLTAIPDDLLHLFSASSPMLWAVHSQQRDAVSGVLLFSKAALFLLLKEIDIVFLLLPRHPKDDWCFPHRLSAPQFSDVLLLLRQFPFPAEARCFPLFHIPLLLLSKTALLFGAVYFRPFLQCRTEKDMSKDAYHYLQMLYDFLSPILSVFSGMPDKNLYGIPDGKWRHVPHYPHKGVSKILPGQS